MPETRVQIVNPLGLHARAAGQLVRLAGNYRSSIFVKRSDQTTTADARSIFSLLSLGAGAGAFIDVLVEGDDADEALAAVAEIVTKGFGEI